MDVTTLSGVVLGFILIVGAVMAGGSGAAFIHIPSLMITMGGTLAALLITYPAHKVKAVFSVARKLLNAGDLHMMRWYQVIVDFAAIARRDGLLALEDRLGEIEDGFLRSGFQMMIDGNSPEDVIAVLENEIVNLEERHEVGHSIFRSLGSYAPAFGMIGTLIGLVQMLKNLNDPSEIGNGMAVALLTTFYGALTANLLCIPMQGKLEQRTKEEVALKRMFLSGVLAIQAGDSPSVVGEKLKAYLNPSERERTRPQS
jgi:chemotaxis protein MotA